MLLPEGQRVYLQGLSMAKNLGMHLFTKFRRFRCIYCDYLAFLFCSGTEITLCTYESINNLVAGFTCFLQKVQHASLVFGSVLEL
ncbi:hypothetical protein Scep_004244 [Stephania cephalantha]|uniref:Uncharacterized protein n=1 Tax=Stephania cephalantha TaxID=152367 RepID=A0AAP0KSZ6_9MAGN